MLELISAFKKSFLPNFSIGNSTNSVVYSTLSVVQIMFQLQQYVITQQRKLSADRKTGDFLLIFLLYLVVSRALVAVGLEAQPQRYPFKMTYQKAMFRSFNLFQGYTKYGGQLSIDCGLLTKNINNSKSILHQYSYHYRNEQRYQDVE